MIFILDDTLMENKDCLNELAKFLLLACEKEQKVKCSANMFDFLETRVLKVDFIGKQDTELIRSNESLWDISTAYQTAFTSVIVGLSPEMMRLDVAMRILNNKSRVVLENSSNDWPTIKKWVELFNTKIRTKYKTVNSIVYKAILNKWLVQEHAGGGGGTIARRLESLADENYADIDRYKLTTVFDSDKTEKNDVDKHKSLFRYLEEHGIFGHELIKRELENYYSWETYTLAHKTSTPTPPTDDNDVYDYLDIAKCENINLQKQDMADMAAFMSPKRLVKRLQNNQGNFGGEYEVQTIILMFAKVI